MKLEDFFCWCYCWWFRHPANQLRLVVYPMIFLGFYTSRVVRRISSINSIQCSSRVFSGQCKVNSQNPTNLGFFQEVLSYVDEFQLNKLDVALSKKKHHHQKCHSILIWKKNIPENNLTKLAPWMPGWLVQMMRPSFLPFWGSLNGLFSRGKLASGLWSVHFPGACFLKRSPKKIGHQKNLRVDNTQQFNRSNGY